MKIQHAYRQVPKPGSNEDQCEDAFGFSAKTLTFAVCDGAGTAFESRLWARLLAERFAANPPLRWNGDQLRDWTDQVAADWNKSIPWPELNVFEEQKASDGSAATLVGLLLGPHLKSANAHVWRCLAIGDSCLFQVRNGQLVSKLPIERSADFGLEPPLLSTDGNANAANLRRLVVKKGTWQPGDMFFMLTDAIARWFLSEHEAGRAPWEFLASSGPGQFATFVRDAQARGQMRKDDVTVFMLGVDIQVGTPGEIVPIPVPARPRPDGDGDLGDFVTPVPVSREFDWPEPRKQPQPKPQPKPQPVPQTKPWPTPQPPARPGQPRPDARRPRAPRPLSPRAGWIVAAALALCLVILPFALPSGSSGPAGPSTSPSASPSPPASPSSSPPPVQTASDFAKTLVSYPGTSKESYQHYLSALEKDEASSKSNLVALLGGLVKAPPGSGQVTVTPDVPAVVPSANPSQATVYVVVQQVTQLKGGKPNDRSFLIELTLVRKGQRWLVDKGEIWSLKPTPSEGKKQ